MEKKRFLFYTSWKKNIDMMDDVELRRFINNLIDHTEGREINLPTRLEKMVWNDVVEVLELNERKRVEVVEKRREAGKKGGAPVGNNNAQKKTDIVNETTKTTKNNQMVEKQTKQPEERSMLSVVCKEKDVVCSKKGDVSSMLNETPVVEDKYDKAKTKSYLCRQLNLTGVQFDYYIVEGNKTEYHNQQLLNQYQDEIKKYWN